MHADCLRAARFSNRFSSKPSIVLIDDEKSICDLLRQHLSAQFDVKTFTDSELGLHEIEATKYDMIITDLAMPKVSGFDIFFAAKKAQPDTPVVFISGQITYKEITSALQNGVKDVLTKPFSDLLDVERVVKKYLL